MPRAEDWRALLTQVIERDPETTRRVQSGGSTLPEPLGEGIINLESGGNPNELSPDNAIGLGQIVPGGFEWGVYQAQHPEISSQDLYDPKTNLQVMVAGLYARQAEGQKADAAGQPHAYEDWYMTAAGYFGGATEQGFTGDTDAFGTSGPEYVRSVRTYVTQTFGANTADLIDRAEPGAAVAAGGDWAYGAIAFDPKATGDPAGAVGYSFGIPGIPDIPGIPGLPDIPNPADVLSGWLSDVTGWVAGWSGRVGLFVVGLVVFGIGAVALVGPGNVAKLTPEGRIATLAHRTARGGAKGGRR